MAKEKELDTSIADKAIIFAVEKHSGSARKGTKLPYIVHPMEAAAIVAGLTDDPDLIAAAVLHDTLEDTDTTFEELVSVFGKRIAELVAGESEDKQEEKPAKDTWKERKQKTIDKLENDADYDSRILALGDKLSNIRAIQRDYEAERELFWKRFNQTDKAEQGWYYSSIAKALKKDSRLKETQALKEYCDRVKAVFGIDC